MAEVKNKSKRQKQAAVRLAIMGAIIICVNVLASYFHSGIDLTKEKRFTLSAPTVKLLKNMKEVAVVDVYLKGKFPAGLQRLQEAVRERLTSFKDIAGNKIVFRFIDPFEGKDDNQKKQIARDLGQLGIRPLELQTQDDQEYSMKVFFPYALVQYNGQQMPIVLLEDKTGSSTPEEKINYAETLLEYKFANALNMMSKADLPRIAYIVGNGEPLGIRTYDLLGSLSRRYYVDTIDLAHVAKISPLLYNAVLVVQPTIPFTDPQKLVLDQYLINGGHMLYVVNTLDASLDSIQVHGSQQMAMDRGLNLDDLLFKYGMRVNTDLVEDKQNLGLARVMNDGKATVHDWLYFPRINPTGEHPIVRNMDFIRAGFTNSIDTIKTTGIKKTILLTTSKLSEKAAAPVRVSLSMMNYRLEDRMFTKSYLPVAILAEGKFHSAFKGRLAPEFIKYLADTMKQPFKAVCDSSSALIVTSIGDVFLNEYSTTNGMIPMGYYKYSREFYANRDFMLNCVEYLTDKSGVLEARSKESKLRLLDISRAKNEKTTWQFVNVAIPIGVVLVFAMGFFFFRKRKYESKENK